MLKRVTYLGIIDPSAISRVRVQFGHRYMPHVTRRWWIWGKYVRKRSLARNYWTSAAVLVYDRGKLAWEITCASNDQAKRVAEEIREDVNGAVA